MIDKATFGSKRKAANNYGLRLALFQRGLTASALARRFNVSPSFACAVVRHEKRSRRLEAQIAQLVGLPREHLWPQ